MPPKKAARKPGSQDTRSTRPQRKREVVDAEQNSGALESTPSKRRRTVRGSATEPVGDEQDEDGEGAQLDADELANAEADTPSRRHASKASATPASVNGANGTISTPDGLHPISKLKLSTPSKANSGNGIDTPGRRTIADRSARRKSARALIDRVVGGAMSDDEAGDENLVRAIYESSGDEEDQAAEEEDEEDAVEDEDVIAATTPSKTTRGRKKGSTRKRSPTPPRDLPSHEMYFFQNKPGLPKTSTNTLASLDLLTHDEYFSILHELKDPHEADIKFLENLHAESFSQWSFELAEGFGLCLYGYGSKRALLHRFAKHMHSKIVDHDTHKIVVINGYLRTTNIREVLNTIVSAVDSSAKLTAGQPATLVPDVLSILSSADLTLTLVVHSADSPPLRKSQFHTIISQLAAHPQVRLVCSVDTPDFPALWDSGQRSNFNFAFHDATTFAPRSTAELEVVDEVHELLGRRARRVGGKDGVAFVLRSLPENAKNLFRLLVGEILVAMEDDSGASVGGENPGVEYRMLYNKAVEEFICSSEMAFRTLLKEFHDHQMITSRKDILGTELLSLPFRREELEAILEDLVS
ncbi:Origin recognition complex subunit 2 [Gnomoniopsis sp. IMI 355080]|nr:Origin recognition complex subunit 2 [Gnomoniopsis sp. IMI 355080]